MFDLKTSSIFGNIWFIWRWLGFYPTKRLKHLYYLYSILLNVVITMLYPTTLTVQLFLTDNVKQLLEALTLTTTNVTNTLKQVNIMINHQDLLPLHDYLNILDSRCQDIAQRDLLQNMTRKSIRMFRIYYLLCIVTGIVNETATFLSSTRRLVYPAWFPFDWKNSGTNYAVIHVYQFIGIMIGIVQSATSDTFPALYVAALTTHVQTLVMRIRSIGNEPGKSSRENYEKLITCIRDYQILTKYHLIIQKVTSYGLLLQFFASGLVACITAVYVLFAKGTLFDTLYLILYLICVLLEILMSCYYGQQLMYESNCITEAIYMCNWIEQSRGFKKILIMFMQMTQRKMVIKAGGIVVVNLGSFMSLIKSSYSLFAVLVKVT